MLTAVFERDDDGYWLVELEEEPRVHWYGRTLAKAREHILDASALWFEVAPEELNLVEDIRLPAPVKASLEAARQERDHARAAQEAAAGATRDGPHAVKDGRLSVHDRRTCSACLTSASNSFSPADRWRVQREQLGLRARQPQGQAAEPQRTVLQAPNECGAVLRRPRSRN